MTTDPRTPEDQQTQAHMVPNEQREVTVRGNGQPKPAGTWDWYGSLDPAHHQGHQWMNTFSIGVFQWIPAGKSRPGQTKKGKSVKRFSAPVHAPHEAYEAATKFIEAQEALSAEEAQE